jgi:hypothetical protein
MKNIILILTLTIVLGSQFSYGQENATIQFNTNALIGVWYPKHNSDKLHLTFEKKATTKHQYGLSIEILINGEFRNRYSAPCGNDTMLQTHNYSGKWNLNEDDMVLTTSKPINHKGTVYKIVELKSDKLVITEIKKE